MHMKEGDRKMVNFKEEISKLIAEQVEGLTAEDLCAAVKALK